MTCVWCRDRACHELGHEIGLLASGWEQRARHYKHEASRLDEDATHTRAVLESQARQLRDDAEELRRLLRRHA